MMNNEKPELDLSFLDGPLMDMMRNEQLVDLDRIQAALRIAFGTVERENNFKDFWTGYGVDSRDARTGISRLGSMLHDWLSRQGIIDVWEAEKHLFEDPPPRTREFITSTRTILEVGLALGAVLATRRVDQK